MNAGCEDGATVFYCGHPCRLAVVRSVWNRVALDGGTLHVSLCNTSNTARIRRLLDGWFLEQARLVLPKLFEEALKRHAWRIRRTCVPLTMRPPGRPEGLRMTVRRMRTRWGSCSADGHITLSAGLIHLPSRLVEYVSVHELCHLAHHNHAPAFWFRVATCLPDWRQRRDELKRWQQRADGG